MGGDGLVARLQRMTLVDCSMHACTVLSWWTVHVSAPFRNNRQNLNHQWGEPEGTFHLKNKL